VPICVELGIRIGDNIWSIVFETQVFRKSVHCSKLMLMQLVNTLDHILGII
jgi:hypothetical protein